MRIVKHMIETKATPTQIWKVWQDVENWKKWDPEIEFSEIDGPFKSGTAGRTKFKGTPVIKTLLTEVTDRKLVVQESFLSFAKIISYQIMRQVGDKTRVTFEVKVRGPLSLFYALILGRFVRKKIPKEVAMMEMRAFDQEVSI